MADPTGHPALNPPFPCNQCGLCCQNVDKAQATAHLDRGDGACQHYDNAQRCCRIYAQRPAICRVDVQYQLHYAERFTWPAFVQANVQVCQQLQRAAQQSPAGP